MYLAAELNKSRRRAKWKKEHVQAKVYWTNGIGLKSSRNACEEHE